MYCFHLKNIPSKGFESKKKNVNKHKYARHSIQEINHGTQCLCDEYFRLEHRRLKSHNRKQPNRHMNEVIKYHLLTLYTWTKFPIQT